MAKKKTNETDELELDQAFFDLTGYTSPAKRRKPAGAFIMILCLLILALVGLAVGIPYLLNDDTRPTAPPTTEPSFNTTNTTGQPTDATDSIRENTVILGIDFSNMTLQEAVTALENLFETDMVVTIEDENYPIHTGDLITSFDSSGAATALLEDPQQFSLSEWLIPNTDAIRDLADSYSVMHQRESVPTTYTITGEMPSLGSLTEEPQCQTLVIVKGTPSVSLDNEALYQAILQALQAGKFTVSVPVSMNPPEALNLNAIWDSSCLAPVDAVMDMTDFRVSESSYGYEFDLEEAQRLLEDAEYGAVLEIPFYRTAPAVTTESLQGLLFRDVLSSASTPHTNDFNRNTNLKLACQAINGLILYPGQEFSYNGALGQRTAAKGYLPAASFMGEETVDTVGGGICQVSSTLYYCTLLADLQVTFRAYHGFAVSYLPLGMDAMVSWGSYDYCFRNDSRYPLRIEAWVADGYVHIRLIGTDERSYYVEMENEIEAIYPYETVYRELSPNNPHGYADGDVIISPYTGYTVHTYRCLYDRQTGELIARYYEDYSDYWSRDEVIAKIVDTVE